MAQFYYDGVFYQITATPSSADPLAIARDMLDHGYTVTGAKMLHINRRKIRDCTMAVAIIALMGMITGPYLVSEERKKPPVFEPRRN